MGKPVRLHHIHIGSLDHLGDSHRRAIPQTRTGHMRSCCSG
jgi:hypothetical protein